MRLSVLIAGLVAGLSLGNATAVPAAETVPVVYDDTWFRAEFWGGEYPDGFSVSRDTEIMIRAATDLSLSRDIACALPKNATYHVWNAGRVDADRLEFVSFTKITRARITTDISTVLDAAEGENSFDMTLRKGDSYDYLVYYGEGSFLIDYKGTRYIAYADLWESSDFGAGDAPTHEWLGLDCGNGRSGWLFMDEVRDLPGIEPARIWQWGFALDLDAPEPVLEDAGSLD